MLNCIHELGVGPYPANIRRWPNVGLLLGHRIRRWSNSKPTSHVCFAGYNKADLWKHPLLDHIQIPPSPFPPPPMRNRHVRVRIPPWASRLRSLLECLGVLTFHPYSLVSVLGYYAKAVLGDHLQAGAALSRGGGVLEDPDESMPSL